MIFCFRVDSSSKIASGHVSRCVTLASYLRENGHCCFFICRDLAGNFTHLIRDNKFDILMLSKPKDAISDDCDRHHSRWLEVTWLRDAEETGQVLVENGIEPDWIIVDHYALDRLWHEHMRSFTKKIMVIDDLADREYDCDVLLDQSLLPQMSSRYETKVDENCLCLLGPRYALLSPEFSERKNTIKINDKNIKNVLLSFGGIDHASLTYMATKAFLAAKREDVVLKIVLPSECSKKNKILELSTIHQNIIVHNPLPSLAGLMAEADFSIGACGLTCWERLCMGIPSLVCTLAENQIPTAFELQKRGLIEYCGHFDSVDQSVLEKRIGYHLNNRLKSSWIKNCFETTDGLGLNKLLSVLSPL